MGKRKNQMGKSTNKIKSHEGEEMQYIRGTFLWSRLPGIEQFWPVCIREVHKKHLLVYCKSDDAEFTVLKKRTKKFDPDYKQVDAEKGKGIYKLRKKTETLKEFLKDIQWAQEETQRKQCIAMDGSSETVAGSSEMVLGDDGTVAAGSSEMVLGNDGTVAAGSSEMVVGDDRTVAAGSGEMVVGSDETVASGSNEMVIGSDKTVAGGSNEIVIGGDKTVAGGSNEMVVGSDKTLASGSNEMVIGSDKTVAGGSNEIVIGSDKTVAGGSNKMIVGSDETVAGGSNEMIVGSDKTVAAGSSEVIVGSDKTVAGGSNEMVIGSDKTVAGGSNEIVVESDKTVAGGSNKMIVGSDETVAGGSNEMVAAGSNEMIVGSDETVAGGSNEMIVGSDKTVAAGSSEVIVGSDKTVTGGSNEMVVGGDKTVAAGSSEMVVVSDETLAAGSSEMVVGTDKTVAGGSNEMIVGSDKTVAGGSNEMIVSSDKTVAAGSSEMVVVSDETITAGSSEVVVGSDETIAAGSSEVVVGSDETLATDSSEMVVGTDETVAARSFKMVVGNDETLAACSNEMVVGNVETLAACSNEMVVGSDETIAAGSCEVVVGSDETIAADSSSEIEYSEVIEESNSTDCEYMPSDEDESSMSSDDSGMSEVFPALQASSARSGSKKKSHSSTCSRIIVQKSNNTSKRKWDKKHYCLFCGIGSTNITKHYVKSKHKYESQVQKILSFPLKSKERKHALEEIRNAGDYKHNCEVLEIGEGNLVSWRSATEDIAATDILPCEFCLAFFLKKDLWRHRSKCKFRKENIQPLQRYRKVTSKASLMLPTNIKTTEGFKSNVLERMSNDQISLVARNDRTIIRFGEKMFQKHGHLRHLDTHISQKVRELARFLILVREEDNRITALSEVLVPTKFPLVLTCTRKLCGYDTSNNTYKNPSLALKLGYSLKKCATISKAAALMDENSDAASKADGFLALCESEWPDEISSCALSTLKTAKWNKPSPLPLTEDVQKLQKLLKEKITNLLKENDAINKSWWMELCEVTLVKLVMFNRRRGGEVERLAISTFRERNKNNVPIKDIENALTPLEKKMCTLFQRVEIRGKKGRPVPVLLTPELVKAINMLIENRSEAGVSENNPFVFARTNYGSLLPIRSSDVVRKYAIDAGVASVENITTTRLRKHIATISQVVNLTENELEQLATFLGHDIQVHRSFYRLPESTLQVAKLGKFLMAIDSGNISQYSGCELDDITIEDEDVTVDEADNDTDGDSDREECQQEASHRIQKINNATAGKVDRLSMEESSTIRKIFQTNISMRKELRMSECLKAIKENQSLKRLGWKKIKNTVHNWITLEKKKTMNFHK